MIRCSKCGMTLHSLRFSSWQGEKICRRCAIAEIRDSLLEGFLTVYPSGKGWSDRYHLLSIKKEDLPPDFTLSIGPIGHVAQLSRKGQKPHAS